MLLMHVTKDGLCAYCGAGVVKCSYWRCQKFFSPKNKRHRFHSAACKMAEIREMKALGFNNEKPRE